MDDKNPSHKAGERIAKAIARAGLASRREAEAWIAAGRVAVNGTVVGSPACNVTAHDRVTVDGTPLPARERTRLFLYHKRRGLMTTHADPQGRPTIFAHLPPNLPRLISVGRLDLNTEGLLLLTNDGALARILELPATGWLRRYRVRAHGAVTQGKLDELRAGITIDGIRYGEIEATLERVQGSNLWLAFAIREGKHHEVRNVLGHLGLAVARLIRVSFGPFRLGELAEGAVEEVRTQVLREQLGARLIARAGVDFSTPMAAPLPLRDDPRNSARPAAAGLQSPDESASRTPASPRSASPRSASQKSAGHKSPSSKSPNPKSPNHKSPNHKSPNHKSPNHKSPHHSWRVRDEERPKKPLRRKFRGSRRDDTGPRQQPVGEARPDVLRDRKGRSVPVERFGHAPPPQPVRQRPRQSAPKRGRRHAPDRAPGTRPRHPRGHR